MANGNFKSFKELYSNTDIKELHKLNAMKLAVETPKSLEQKEVVPATKRGKDFLKHNYE